MPLSCTHCIWVCLGTAELMLYRARAASALQRMIETSSCSCKRFWNVSKLLQPPGDHEEMEVRRSTVEGFEGLKLKNSMRVV
jgi:hypothetical protein